MTRSRSPIRIHAPFSVLVLLLGTGLWSSTATAGVRVYVDKDGRGGSCNDSRDYATAQNPATPVCSIERGMALAQAGDTVLVRGATFVRSGPLGLGKANIVLKAYPGELVILDFSGAATGNGINFGADGVVLEGFEITNAPEEGVAGWFTNNIVIRRNHVHHCGLVLVNGKYQNGVTAYGTNVLIEQNHVHDTGSHNLYIYGDRITVRNNVIYRTIAPLDRGSYGIQVGTTGANCTNITIAHNVISESVNRSSVVLYAPSATISNVVIVNNVLMANANNPVYVYNDAGVATTFSAIQIKNNVFAQNAGNCVYFTATGSCSTPPGTFTVSGNLVYTSTSLLGFRNLATRDYYPAAGSVLLNAALPGYATNDYVGTTRPQGSAPDIGAYEGLVGGGPDVIAPAAIRDLF